MCYDYTLSCYSDNNLMVGSFIAQTDGYYHYLTGNICDLGKSPQTFPHLRFFRLLAKLFIGPFLIYLQNFLRSHPVSKSFLV